MSHVAQLSLNVTSVDCSFEARIGSAEELELHYAFERPLLIAPTFFSPL